MKSIKYIINKKRIIIILFFALVVQYSIGQRAEFVLKETKLGINIENANKTDLVIDIRPVILSQGPSKPNQMAVVLDNNNNASVKLMLDGPTYIKVINMGLNWSKDFLVFPGNDFSLKLDENNLEFAEYNSQWKKEDDFYNKVLKNAGKNFAEITQTNSLEFIKEFELERAHNEILINDALKNGISKQCSDWVLQSVEALSNTILIKQLLNYVTIYERWPDNIDSYFALVEKYSPAQLNQTSYFNTEYDKDMMGQYFLFLALTDLYRNDSSSVPSIEDIYKYSIVQANLIENPIIKGISIQSMLTSVVSKTCNLSFLNWIKDTINNDSDQNKYNYEYFSKLIDQQISISSEQAKGMKALSFNGEDKDGNTFSYDNYKDKFIYIDVWATWCAPCIAQFPHLDVLKQKYKNDPIAFVGMATDKTKEVWEKYIEKNNLVSDQYISNSETGLSINEVYGIKGIPRFIIIDKEGKIINTNTFRPSDPAIIMLLDKLLEK